MGMFDDLIPAQPKSASGSFDDLIPAVPKAVAQSSGVKPIVPRMEMPETPELVTTGPGPTGRIDPALYEQGILPRRYQEQIAPETSMGGDIAQAFGANLLQGVANVADFPGQILNAGGGLIIDGAGLLGMPENLQELAKQELQRTPLGSGRTAREGFSMLTGGQSDYEGQSREARIIGNAAEFAPAALLGPGNRLLNLINFGIIPGAASEVAGQMAEGKRVPESIPLIGGMDAEPLARATTAIFSPMVATALENKALGLITPNPARPVDTEAARKLADEGVTLTAGQRVDSDDLRYIEASRPATTEVVKEQANQFTRAALRRIGVDADAATPDVMFKAGQDIGRDFNMLAASNRITPDATLNNAVRSAVNEYADNSTTGVIAGIKKTANMIDAYVKSNRPITGTQYQQWRSQLGRLSVKGESQQAKQAARDILKALDDAMERTLTAAGREEEILAYRAARAKWRDYLAIADAVDGAGVNAARGVVTPQNLGNAVRAQDEMAYVTGRRDLGELARAGTISMPPLPNSGTQPRLAVHQINALSGAQSGAGVGGLAFALTRDPLISAAFGATAALAPSVRNALIATPAMQAYLSNQLVTSRVPQRTAGLLGPVINTMATTREEPPAAR